MLVLIHSDCRLAKKMEHYRYELCSFACNITVYFSSNLNFFLMYCEKCQIIFNSSCWIFLNGLSILHLLFNSAVRKRQLKRPLIFLIIYIINILLMKIKSLHTIPTKVLPTWSYFDSLNKFIIYIANEFLGRILKYMSIYKVQNFFFFLIIIIFMKSSKIRTTVFIVFCK